MLSLNIIFPWLAARQGCTLEFARLESSAFYPKTSCLYKGETYCLAYFFNLFFWYPLQLDK